MSDAPSFPRPNAAAIAGRTLVLTLMQIRLGQEAITREGSRSQKEEAHAMISALAQLGTMLHSKQMFSQEEWRLYDSRLGSWSDQDGVNIDWRGECIGVFGWALGKESRILPFDQRFEVDGKEYMNSMLSLLKSGAASLRPQAEIDNAQEIAKIWNWRSRTTRIIKEGHKPPPGLTFPQIIEVTAKGSHDLGWFGSPIRGDFPIFGKAYTEISDIEYSTATSIAMERHYALNWLCGYADNWDDVPTGT